FPLGPFEPTTNTSSSSALNVKQEAVVIRNCTRELCAYASIFTVSILYMACAITACP
ncbi:5149_t:CDS:2, partial [Ambispora gerdemannii]